LLKTEIGWHENDRLVSSTHLTLEDGTIKMNGEDSGPVADEWLGRDYVYWITVPPAAAGKLAYELLAEKYRGDWEAISKFRTWCKAHDVSARVPNLVAAEKAVGCDAAPRPPRGRRCVPAPRPA
jgi:hypothetical protein